MRLESSWWRALEAEGRAVASPLPDTTYYCVDVRASRTRRTRPGSQPRPAPRSPEPLSSIHHFVCRSLPSTCLGWIGSRCHVTGHPFCPAKSESAPCSPASPAFPTTLTPRENTAPPFSLIFGEHGHEAALSPVPSHGEREEAERYRTWYIFAKHERGNTGRDEAFNLSRPLDRSSRNRPRSASLSSRPPLPAPGGGKQQSIYEGVCALWKRGEWERREKRRRNPKGPIPREPCFTTQAYDGSGKQKRGTCAVLLANLEGW